MKKTLSLILTICLVFVGVVSFSVPVRAANYSLYNKGFSSSRTINNSSYGYHIPLSASQYLQTFTQGGQTGNFYEGQNGKWNLSVGSTYGSYAYDTFYLYKHYIFLADLPLPPSKTDASIYINKITGSYKFSELAGVSNPHFELATLAMTQSGQCLVAFASDSGNVFFQYPSMVPSLYFVYYTYSSSPNPSVDIDLSFTLGQCFYNATGTLESIQDAIVNETRSQTDTMTNGYDNSSMSSDNTRLNDKIAQYDQAQEDTTNKSTSYIDGAEFVNPFSNATVLASVTFATSFLQSLFMNLDIWQLVVTVSLCLVLALMLVGWFKFRGN